MRVYSVIIGLLLTFCGFRTNASHIVGGELTYTCLGNNIYRIHLDIYQDCLNGEPQAIQQDNPAFIAIYDGLGNFVRFDSIGYSERIIVPPNFKNDCIKNPPPTCLTRMTFVRDYSLPPNSSGYYITYQRCCRNATIRNIISPGSVGATYFARIPPSNVHCNNSAVFKNYPPQIICVNNPLVYDHSAVDPDGDILTYEFCDAYIGGSINDVKPFPQPPPYQSVGYITPPYSAQVPVFGNPPIKIDPNTGLITGTPTLEGRFVVTVCCNEWRNGVIINTVKREFQFVVTNCSKAVVADIPQYSDEFNTYIVECNSKTVHFDNTSQGGFSYFWDFGVPGATSTDFEPTYTYPDTGTYVVKLVVNRGTTCPDSISRFVKVYPTFKADFNVTGLACPNVPLQFMDLSVATYPPVVSWNWNFGDTTTSVLQNPQHTYIKGGDYDVTLIAKSVKGCVDTVTTPVKVQVFEPHAANDTIIVVGESIYFNASGGDNYTWTPGNYLNSTTIRTPIGYYPDLGIFTYYVHITTDFGCQGNDTFTVQVVNQASIFVPSGFTPNNDGLNDIIKPLAVGYRKMNYFRIFNRWGEEVYNTNQINAGWDGRWKGQPAEIGTYYYVLSLIDRFGQEQRKKGDITLIR